MFVRSRSGTRAGVANICDAIYTIAASGASQIWQLGNAWEASANRFRRALTRVAGYHFGE